MLHNSLFWRDLLRGRNAHPLIVARRNPHRNVGRGAHAAARSGQVELSGAWSLHPARNLPSEQAVAEDARDFLEKMGVKVADGGGQILMEIGSCARGFRIVVDARRVEVHAADASSLWGGWVSLEHEMRRNGGPFLAGGERAQSPAWEVQIAPPTWGSNDAVPDFTPEYVSDETFRSLAHQGVNGMLIYGDMLVYSAGSRFHELDHPNAAKHVEVLRDAFERALKYGIRFYWCVVGPKLPGDHALFGRVPEARGAKLAWGRHNLHCLCSSSAEALAFHAESIRNVIRAAPELGGLILIIGGESYYHCFMRSADSAKGQTNCPRCKGKLAEDVIANLLKVTADAARQAKPDIAVMAWPYSAHHVWAAESSAGDLIERLPDGVGFLSEIDKDEPIAHDGYQKMAWDYTVEAEKASAKIKAQRQLCVDAKRDLWVKCETAHGVELMHIPYVPGLTRSARMWADMRKLSPRGLLQRWGFIGMFDSPAERIAFKARWDSAFDPDHAADEAAREFVGERSGDVIRAWRKFDESLGHIPLMTTGGYYIGPLFLGPAHPLRTWSGETPATFCGNLFYLAEEQATFSTERREAHDDLTLRSVASLGAGGGGPSIEQVEREFARAADLAQEGHEILSAIDSALDEPWKTELIEQQCIGECLYRTLRACANTVRFLRERDGANDPVRLRAIAGDELDNARGALAMYERAPWLSHALRLDLACNESADMVREKIRLLEQFLG